MTTATLTKVPAKDLRPGDVILPPEREMALWMRRHIRESGLPETALYLTIEEIHDGAPDTRGPWLVVRSRQAEEWYAGHRSYPFTFKVRPATPWPLISRANTSESIAIRATRFVIGDRVRESPQQLRLLGFFPSGLFRSIGVVTEAIDCSSPTGIPTQRLSVQWPAGALGVLATQGDTPYWTPVDLVQAEQRQR